MGNIAFRPMQFSEFRAYKPYPWRINKYSNFQWDCIPLPTGTEGENKTEVENLMMGISNQTQHSQIAWQFLKMLTYNQETQKKLFQYSQGISALKAITNSKEVEDILEEDMGEDTVVKVELLNKVMEHQAETYKFRTYTSVEHYIDQEIMELIQEDDGFDEDLLEIKREADKQLNE
jgi:multiple sugar transport system substrate-binding protein